MRAFCLRPEQVEEAWSELASFFERFEKDGHDLSAKDVKAKALESGTQVWGLQDEERVHGILATEIVPTAHGRVCVITAAHGSAPEEDKRQLMESVRRFAKENGCTKIRIHGRPGWLRWDRRFEPVGIIAEMSLEGMS